MATHLGSKTEAQIKKHGTKTTENLVKKIQQKITNTLSKETPKRTQGAVEINAEIEVGKRKGNRFRETPEHAKTM